MESLAFTPKQQLLINQAITRPKKKWCNEEELIWVATLLLSHGKSSVIKTDQDYANTIALFKKGSTMQQIPFLEPHWLIVIIDETLFYERFPRRVVLLK